MKKKILNKNTKLVIKKNISKAYIIVTTIISLIASVQWGYDKLNNPNRVMDYQKNAIKYYENERYEKSIYYSHKAYNANKYVPGVIYYYCSALLKENDVDELRLANEILFENEEILDVDEMVLYAQTEMLLENYENAYRIINLIEDPLKIDIRNIRKYIAASTISAFELGYDEGVTRANMNYILLEKILNSFSSRDATASSYIFLESDFERVINTAFDNVWEDNKYYVKYTKLQLSEIFYHYAVNNKDDGKLSIIIGLTADSFGLFKNHENGYNESYLRMINYYMSSYDTYFAENYSAIQSATNKIIEEYEYQKQNNNEYYNEDIEKYIIAYNMFVDKHNLDWDKYDATINTAIEGSFNFNSVTTIETIKVYNNISIKYIRNPDNSISVNYTILPGSYGNNEEVFIKVAVDGKPYCIIPAIIR